MSESIAKPLRYEPSNRWVRTKFGGVFIADSRNTLLVWDSHHIPVYWFPIADVRLDLLQETGRSRGERLSFHIKVGDQVASNAARRYAAASGERALLNDYIAFSWYKMDHWYEEAEEVFVHARDPYTRIDTIPSTRHIRVEVDGVTVADSQRAYFLFETHLPTRYYLPAEDVRLDFLEASDTHSSCPYKGIASYWSVKINGTIYKDIVWGYPEPIPEIPKVKDLLSFYNEKVDIFIDGELEAKPQTFWS